MEYPFLGNWCSLVWEISQGLIENSCHITQQMPLHRQLRGRLNREPYTTSLGTVHEVCVAAGDMKRVLFHPRGVAPPGVVSVGLHASAYMRALTHVHSPCVR